MLKKIVGAALCAAVLAGASAPAFAKTAVVYFSATGTTRAVAINLSQAVGADLFEIKPAEPYTSADLNWHDENCRTTVEMHDPDSRPAIGSDLSAVTGYDTVAVGFPVWWHTAPHIINTFFEQYDLTGHEIYLFCTSGGSSIEQSVSELKAAYPRLNIVKGTRLYRSSSGDELKAAAGR